MPNENWFKLIGGRADGMLIDIPMRPLPQHLQIRVPITEEVTEMPRTDIVGEETVIYRLSHLAGSTKMFPVYARDGMNGDAILERLLRR